MKPCGLLEGKDAVQHIIQETECSVLCINTQTLDKVKPLLPVLESVHTIVLWGANAKASKEVIHL